MKYSITIAAAIVVGVSCVACGSSPTRPTPITSPTTRHPPDPPPTDPIPVPPPRTTRTRYLAFGDSITAGTTSPAVTLWRPFSAGLPQSYPFKLHALLTARYAGQTIDMVNEGKPGEAAADGAVRFLATLRAAAPEVVILLHGVNDITFQGMAGVRRTAEHVDTMAREARSRGSDVMVCTLPPHRPGGFRAADAAVIRAYNEALRQVARGEGAVLVDFEAAGFDLRLVGLDGLHPTEEGYARMAEILFSHARARFEIGS